MKKSVLIAVLLIFVLMGLSLEAQSWSSLRRMTWNSGSSILPFVAVDSSDNLFVVWTDQTAGNYEVYYKESLNGGSLWGGFKRLTWNSGDSWFPIIAVDSNKKLHVVWNDDTPGNDEIFYRNR